MQGARPRVGGAHERRALEASGLVVGLRASGRRQGDAELGEAALDVHSPHECRAARTDRGQQRGGERSRGQERSGAAEHSVRSDASLRERKRADTGDLGTNESYLGSDIFWQSALISTIKAERAGGLRSNALCGTNRAVR